MRSLKEELADITIDYPTEDEARKFIIWGWPRVVQTPTAEQISAITMMMVSFISYMKEKEKENK
jgi:hypothetical protein